MIPRELCLQISHSFSFSELLNSRLVNKEWNCLAIGFYFANIEEVRKICLLIQSLRERLEDIKQISKLDLSFDEVSSAQFFRVRVLELSMVFLAQPNYLENFKRKVLTRLFTRNLFPHKIRVIVERKFKEELTFLKNNPVFLEKLREKFIKDSPQMTRDYSSIFTFISTQMNESEALTHIEKTNTELEAQGLKKESLIVRKYVLRRVLSEVLRKKNKPLSNN